MEKEANLYTINSIIDENSSLGSVQSKIWCAKMQITKIKANIYL